MRDSINALMEYGILLRKRNQNAGGGYGDDEIYFLTKLSEEIISAGSDRQIAKAVRALLRKKNPKIQDKGEWVSIPRWNQP